MPRSEFGRFAVRAKTHEVVDFHYDDTRPGKPLRFLVPGGLIAVASLVTIIYIVYQTWYEHHLSEDRGFGMTLLLLPFYIGGVFLLPRFECPHCGAPAIRDKLPDDEKTA